MVRRRVEGAIAATELAAGEDPPAPLKTSRMFIGPSGSRASCGLGDAPQIVNLGRPLHALQTAPRGHFGQVSDPGAARSSIGDGCLRTDALGTRGDNPCACPNLHTDTRLVALSEGQTDGLDHLVVSVRPRQAD